MTLKQVSDSLYGLSVFGYFNGEKFTRAQLRNYLKRAFRPETQTSSWVMEIALPDGRWFCQVSRYSPASDGFDYFIPETRAQEQRLLDRLVNRA